MGYFQWNGQPGLGIRRQKESSKMFDPVLHHLHQAKQSAQWFAQLIQLEPQLVLPAALPLLAARLMDAGGVEDDGDDEVMQAEAVVI